jgi:hypothetical protein
MIKVLIHFFEDAKVSTSGSLRSFMDCLAIFSKQNSLENAHFEHFKGYMQ